MKRLFAGLILGCWALLPLAEPVELKAGHPDTYQVKEGDNLWNIASTFLKDPWLWPEIWYLNPKISNPHLIFPKDKLALINIKDKNGEEQTKLTVVERGEDRADAASDTTGAAGTARSVGENKLHPAIRTSAIEAAIPAIPLEKISAFLSKSRVVDQGELDAAPYVIAGQGKRLLSGAGDKLYARGDFKPDETIYGIYRPGEIYIDPVTKENLGIQALGVGSVRLASQKDDVATMILNQSHEEVRINDRLLPSEHKKVTATFFPKMPDTKINGVIISIEGGLTQVSSLDVVAMNVGERNGLVVGDVLAIAQAGELVKDQIKNELVQLPDERAGLLIVFRTFQKMAFGFVVNAERPLRVGDKVRNP